MVWPWSTPSELAACRSAVQSAYCQTDQVRSNALSALISDKERETCRRDGGPIAVLSMHARWQCWVLGRGLTEAIREDGVQVADVGVRGPGDVHPLSRARLLGDRLGGQPTAAVLLDVVRQDVRNILPDSVPVISWLGSLANVDSSMGSKIGEHDLVAVTSARLRDRVVTAGVPEGQIAVVPHPCLALPMAADGPEARPIDVAVIADLVPVEPERFGHTLWTHVRIWRTAMDLIRARLDSFEDEQGEAILARAEQKIGSRIDDVAMRRAMAEVLSGSVANAVLWPWLVERLLAAGIRPAVYGRGWQGAASGCVQGEGGDLASRMAILRQAKVLLYADVRGDVSDLPLLAGMVGTAIVARSHNRDTQSGGLATLLSPEREIEFFQRSSEMVSVIKRLVGEVESRRLMIDQARARCVTDHRPMDRWRALKTVASSFFEGRVGQV